MPRFLSEPGLGQTFSPVAAAVPDFQPGKELGESAVCSVAHSVGGVTTADFVSSSAGGLGVSNFIFTTGGAASGSGPLAIAALNGDV